MNLPEMLAEQLEWTRSVTLETFADLRPGELLFQPRPDMNHPLWLLGHIAASENHLILEWCTGESLLPKEYGKLFAMGSKPLADATAYPSDEELREKMAVAHAMAVEYIRSADDSELARPPIGVNKMPERAKGLFTTRGKCVWFHAVHEAQHNGQLAYLRRLLGKPTRI